jgi:hypothetical protein
MNLVHHFIEFDNRIQVKNPDLWGVKMEKGNDRTNFKTYESDKLIETTNRENPYILIYLKKWRAKMQS